MRPQKKPPALVFFFRKVVGLISKLYEKLRGAPSTPKVDVVFFFSNQGIQNDALLLKKVLKTVQPPTKNDILTRPPQHLLFF